jgi:hypothetical protein
LTTLSLLAIPDLATLTNTIPPPYWMMLSHCTVGLVAAQMAHRKGYDLGIWILWGTIGGTAALVDVLRRP